MSQQFKTASKAAMDKAVDSLTRELSKVRTGKANVSMLDAVRVNYYGTPTPISQVAAVSCPDARSFLIAPWEVSNLKEIESSIVKSELGMTPMNDGKVIRLKLPELTEERRKDLVKQVKKIAEDCRVAIRLARRDANDAIKKDKTIPEDQSKKLQEEIQKMTDEFIAKVDKVGSDKEKELMTL
jgi:ribosome recycling factor